MANNSTDYQTATAEAQRCYLAALFFHGLNNKTPRELKRRYIIIPSQAQTQSPVFMTRCFNWLINTSHLTSNALPGAAVVDSLLLKKENLARPLPHHPPHWMPPPRKVNQGRENPTPSPARRTLPARFWPTHWVKRTASTVAVMATGLPTALIFWLPSTMSC